MATFQRQDPASDVTRELVREFAGSIPEADVSRTVRGARHDLEGQIVPTAFPEMLHRLARYRLTHRA